MYSYDEILESVIELIRPLAPAGRTVAESTDLVHWTNPRLAMGFGPAGEFDAGGCVIGARPINLHLKGFEGLGARITIEIRCDDSGGASACHTAASKISRFRRSIALAIEPSARFLGRTSRYSRSRSEQSRRSFSSSAAADCATCTSRSRLAIQAVRAASFAAMQASARPSSQATRERRTSSVMRAQ